MEEGAAAGAWDFVFDCPASWVVAADGEVDWFGADAAVGVVVSYPGFGGVFVGSGPAAVAAHGVR